MCGNRISVQFRFLKTRTEAKRSNPKFRFLCYRGFSQNQTCLIQIVNIWAILTNTIWFKLKFKLNFKKHAFETNWAFRKPSTKMQYAHTRKTAYTFFLYFTTDLQRKPNWTDGFSKPNRNWNRTRSFSQNRTETKPNLNNPFRTSLISRT